MNEASKKANPTAGVTITLFDDGTAVALPRRYSADGNAVREYEPQSLSGGYIDSAATLIGSILADAEMAAGEFKPAQGGDPLKEAGKL